MEFHVYQVLYLDNLIWYMGNTDQFLLPHCHMWLNIHVGLYMGALKLSLSGSGQPSDPPPGSVQGLPCPGTSLPPALTLLPPFTQPPRSQRAQLHLLTWRHFPALSIACPISPSSVFHKHSIKIYKGLVFALHTGLQRWMDMADAL